jgi:hypothetical protein
MIKERLFQKPDADHSQQCTRDLVHIERNSAEHGSDRGAIPSATPMALDLSFRMALFTIIRKSGPGLISAKKWATTTVKTSVTISIDIKRTSRDY